MAGIEVQTGELVRAPRTEGPVECLVKCDKHKCVYYEFFDSVSCLFAEGVEFMNRTELYAAIKRDWEKCLKRT